MRDGMDKDLMTDGRLIVIIAAFSACEGNKGVAVDAITRTV